MANVVPSIRPKSWIETMPGWERAATALASASKRDSARGLDAKGSGRTLRATSLSSFVSRARQTTPIPPAAIGAITT